MIGDRVFRLPAMRISVFDAAVAVLYLMLGTPRTSRLLKRVHPRATILLIPLGFVTGLLIGEWWSLALAVIALPLAAPFDWPELSDERDIDGLPRWVFLAGMVAVDAAFLAAGVAIRQMI